MDKLVKTFKSKKGNDIVFRYPQKGDFSAVYGYACDLADEDTYIELNARPTKEEERVWFDGMHKAISQGKAMYIHVYHDEKLIGSGRVLRGKYRHSHVGQIGISLSANYREEGIGTQLMHALIDEARAAGIRLLTLHCFENNPRAIHVYEKLGFKKSGITPGAVAFKGDYVGEINMYLPLI